MMKPKQNSLCELDWKFRIVVSGAVGRRERVLDQSVCSCRLTLPPVLQQEESKQLSQHTCHSVVTIGLLKFNSGTLMQRGDGKSVTKSHLPVFDGQYTSRQMFVYMLQTEYKQQRVLIEAAHCLMILVSQLFAFILVNQVYFRN